MESVISIRGLSKTYGQGPFKKGFRALNDVSLDVGEGSVFGLLGPNGAGKTTLIKILMGLVPRWRGEARILGRSAGDAEARKRIGFLPEAHRLPGYLTGRQVLRLYGMYSGRSPRWLDERIPGWLDRVGMTEGADRKVKEYSKGMQQRIGLAQALVHEPELIFLDEPTDGVDPVGRAAVREIIAGLRDSGVTVFINSHLLMEVERMCDHVVIMSKGRIIRQGSVDELTPRTGRVAFEVKSPTDELSSLLTGLGADYQANPKGFEVTLSEEEQNEVIDRLRAKGVTIRGIQPRKLTLEESFIDLVQGESQ